MLAQMPTTGIISLIYRSAPKKFINVEIWQELDTGAWFKFSDETVVPLNGKIKLGVQEDDGMKKVSYRHFLN